MSVAPPPVLEASPALKLTSPRLAGYAGLTFAAGVLAANVLLAGIPTPAETFTDAAAWLEANRVRAALGSAMVGITFPALLLFGAAMYDTGRHHAAARRWMLAGALGATGMVSVFSLVVASQIAAVLLAETGGDGFAAAWAVHNAAFAVNMTVLGTAFLGFAVGAHAAGFGSRALRHAGVLGASLLLVSGLANAVVAAGSPVALVGFAGFLLWLVWLVAISWRLVRTAD